ncbi:MAG TPA: hypothetical protein VM049_11310 [Gaiellaceae bacterium]|nr:hypothetical protein [Gaiellaceae bacterium]
MDVFHPTPAPLLLPSQKREIFELIRESDFDPRQFELSDDGRTDSTGKFAEVVHTPSRYHFRIRESAMFEDSGWRVEMSPGTETRTGYTNLGAWQDVPIPIFKIWLGLLERELDAGEDPWEQIQREREIVAAEPGDVENTPFSESERAQISTQLREIKEYLRTTQSLGAAQMVAIDSRLEYLEEAAGRIGRVDWRNAFVGVMLGLVVEAVAPPEAVREVLSLALRGLSHLFGGALPELPPG